MKKTLIKFTTTFILLLSITGCDIGASNTDNYLGGWVRSNNGKINSTDINFVVTKTEEGLLVSQPSFSNIKSYKALIDDDGVLRFDVGMGIMDSLIYQEKTGNILSGGREYVHIDAQEAEKRLKAIIESAKNEVGKPLSFPKPITNWK